MPNEEEVVEVTEVAPAAAPNTDEVGANVEVEEVADPLTQAVNSLRELTDRIEQSSKAQSGELEELKKSVSSLDSRFEDRLNTVAEAVKALEGQQAEFTKRFEGLDVSVDEVRKGLTSLDASSALRKSVDSDQSTVEEKPKSIWAGSFLPTVESL